MLTSDRQHRGLLDIDKVTISDTLSKSSIIRDSYKLVHIKVTKPDENIWKDKKEWLESRGFKVITTIGNWQNDNSSHGRGIIDDIAKIYNDDAQLLYKQFVFQIENDWIFETPNLDNSLSQSLSILTNHPEIIYHRHSRTDKSNMVTELAAKDLGNNEYLTNREFSFNPFMSRPKDMKYISNFVAKNNIHEHCEMAFEIGAKYLNNNNYIFGFNNSGIVRHVGDRLDKEWYENKLKELK